MILGVGKGVYLVRCLRIEREVPLYSEYCDVKCVTLYLALTLLISLTFENIMECCVLSSTDSGTVESIFGSSMNRSVSVVRLRWYVASDVMISKIAFEKKHKHTLAMITELCVCLYTLYIQSLCVYTFQFAQLVSRTECDKT